MGASSGERTIVQFEQAKQLLLAEAVTKRDSAIRGKTRGLYYGFVLRKISKETFTRRSKPSSATRALSAQASVRHSSHSGREEYENTSWRLYLDSFDVGPFARGRFACKEQIRNEGAATSDGSEPNSSTRCSQAIAVVLVRLPKSEP